MEINNLKVLVAEDSQMNVLLMRKILAKWNITPHFVADGSAAVSAFKTTDYDVILMDIHMPLMDGYEASRIIRTDPDPIKSQIPIIALTASIAIDIREEIEQAGINDFICKPFDIDELRGKLEEIAARV